MGIICVILTVIITYTVFIFAGYNSSVSVSVPGFEYTFFVFVCLVIYALGILAGVLLMLCQYFETQKQYAKLKKQYDKATIGADNAEDKVQVLENKIATLEAALKSALEK